MEDEVAALVCISLFSHKLFELIAPPRLLITVPACARLAVRVFFKRLITLQLIRIHP